MQINKIIKRYFIYCRKQQQEMTFKKSIKEIRKNYEKN